MHNPKTLHPFPFPLLGPFSMSQNLATPLTCPASPQNSLQNPKFRPFNSHMAALPVLTFITSNKNKLSEVQTILGNDVPVELQNQSVDIVEIQGSIEEVARDKCRRASELVCHSPSLIFSVGHLYSRGYERLFNVLIAANCGTCMLMDLISWLPFSTHIYKLPQHHKNMIN
jgi:hypothetical protein